MKRLFYTFIILPKEAYTGERSKDGHYFVYNTDNDYIYHSGEKYGLEADMSCSDVSRACFLCHDPKAYASSEILNHVKNGR